MVIIYGGTSLEKVTRLVPFSIFHATRYNAEARVSPHKGPGSEIVHVAICVKKAGSISNLGSREGQVEHTLHLNTDNEGLLRVGAALRYAVALADTKWKGLFFMACTGVTTQSSLHL